MKGAKAGRKANKMARNPKTSNTSSNFGKAIPKMKDYTGKRSTGTLPGGAVRGLRT
jgi:hypothetical protein